MIAEVAESLAPRNEGAATGNAGFEMTVQLSSDFVKTLPSKQDHPRIRDTRMFAFEYS
jgi:hypothetical protein